ncbi:MAG: transglutaminase domain-containing protein [bacterium]
MVLLCAATAETLYHDFTPAVSGYRRGSRPAIERTLRAVIAGSPGTDHPLAAVAAFCHSLQDKVAGQDNMDDWRFGGTEEDITERGTDWCTDVSRVACVLCQVAGYPARLVQLADLTAAYSGHMVIEAFADGRWAVMDPLHGLLHRHGDGTPAAALDLNRNLALADLAHQPLYSAIAISNYFVQDRDRYDYAVSGINPAYRQLLGMSVRGWPGGLRWLHGEDRA